MDMRKLFLVLLILIIADAAIAAVPIPPPAVFPPGSNPSGGNTYIPINTSRYNINQDELYVQQQYYAGLDTGDDSGTDLNVFMGILTEQSLAIEEIRANISALNAKLEEYSKTRSSPMSNLYTILIIIIFVLFVISTIMFFMLYKRSSGLKKEEKQMPVPPSPPRSNDVNIRLKNYILFNLKKGYQPHMIKQSLLKQGYNHQDIDNAFRV